ncbi:Hypothetical predicted protein [Olea europaea subsp. europaea]|uniref:Uncharacterized protein n=1 Tax=Olea europaea subsp. europaea TaxID=158383 RepID=A0A8S0S864_OLEEU|nr:Hypothetical predicted protein [Olea europaea subsp. europaea]
MWVLGGPAPLQENGADYEDLCSQVPQPRNATVVKTSASRWLWSCGSFCWWFANGGGSGVGSGDVGDCSTHKWWYDAAAEVARHSNVVDGGVEVGGMR